MLLQGPFASYRTPKVISIAIFKSNGKVIFYLLMPVLLYLIGVVWDKVEHVSLYNFPSTSKRNQDLSAQTTNVCRKKQLQVRQNTVEKHYSSSYWIFFLENPHLHNSFLLVLLRQDRDFAYRRWKKKLENTSTPSQNAAIIFRTAKEMPGSGHISGTLMSQSPFNHDDLND